MGQTSEKKLWNIPVKFLALENLSIDFLLPPPLQKTHYLLFNSGLILYGSDRNIYPSALNVKLPLPQESFSDGLFAPSVPLSTFPDRFLFVFN